MKKLNLLIFVLLSHFTLFLWVQVSQAAEFTVTTVQELREALDIANDEADQDVITLAPGDYQLSGPSDDDNNLSGDLDIKTNLVLQGAGARETILRGSPDGDRVIHVLSSQSPEDLSITVMDLTIRDGNVPADDFIGSGGGILYDGGVEGILEIRNCSIIENYIQQGNGNGSGGGISDGGKHLHVENSIITNNQVLGPSRRGGAIFSISQTALLKNSTISNNLSGSLGGGVVLANMDATIENSTVTQNESLSDGTGGIIGDNIIVRNSIIAGNISVSPGKSDCDGIITSQGYNIFGTFCLGLTLGPSDQIVPASNLFLGPLQDSGGPTDTHALLNGSPAIDRGDPGNCPDTDQRGIERPQGIACDIGAFEVVLICGDGILQDPEECDDGSITDDDGCNSQCLDEDTGGNGDSDPDSGGCSLSKQGEDEGSIALVVWLVFSMLVVKVYSRSKAIIH
jgi:cysteine-rich repeat protein